MAVTFLDYTTPIRLHYESEIEKSKRITACAKERETVTWLESLPSGSVVFDIGACIGAYSLVAASLGHRVIAFEPAAMNYARLVQNLALNPELHVLALPLLLTWKTGMTHFGYSSLETGAALHVTGQSNGGFTQPMVGWALDDLMRHTEIALPHPTAIKLDVDGHELSVLKGAEQTLRQVQTLLVEIDDSLEESRHIEGVLGLWGFDVKSRHPHGTSPISNVVFSR